MYPPRRRRADPVELLVALVAATAAVIYLAPPNAGRLHGRGPDPVGEVTHPLVRNHPARTDPGLSGLGIVIQPASETRTSAGEVAAP